MTRSLTTVLFVCFFAVARVCAQASNHTFEIGIVDTFGLNRVSAIDIRKALTFSEGARVSIGDTRPPFLAESESRLLGLPNVASAHINIVCCDQGRLILFVGIQEDGATVVRFRDAPKGDIRLKADVIEAGKELENAISSAVQRGEGEEDDSRGHALMRDPTTRAIQERFVVYAARDLSELRRALRESSDPRQRALAVEVLAYANNKQSVVNDLVFSMSDPDEGVRNNAMRALAVFARMVPPKTRQAPRIPLDPFIAFLNSPVWTDRNKSSFALYALSERRDPELLSALRKQAMTPLVEMARWKSKGHAMPAFFILGRMAGLSEDEIQSAWNRDEREIVIESASKGQ